MLKKILLFSLVTILLIGSNLMAEAKSLNNKWDKVFPKSDKVNVQKVEFKNRFGITLVGDLYVPKGVNAKLKNNHQVCMLKL